MFRGSMVAVVTPMQADGALDFEALARLVEFHIENGTDAIIVRDSQGAYHADIPLTAPGQWAYRWECVAPHAGAAEGVITVQKSRVI